MEIGPSCKAPFSELREVPALRWRTKVRVVPLVEEQLVAHSLDDDVPGVDRAGAAHQGGQDGVRGKNVALGLGELERERERERHVKSIYKNTKADLETKKKMNEQHS